MQTIIIRIIALDYYDGPLGGVFQTVVDGWFRFDTVARDEKGERVIFCLGRFPAVMNPGHVIEVALLPESPPAQGLWVPKWQFPNPQAQLACDRKVDEILNAADDYSMVVVADQLRLGPCELKFMSGDQQQMAFDFRKTGNRQAISRWIQSL